MRLGTKGHYGLHAMMDLGARYGKGAVLLREICETFGFSQKYLEQLLRALRQAGLVESVRGARGGYWLAKPPEKITILEIIEALEGAMLQLPSKCSKGCRKHDHCALHTTWLNSIEKMRDELGQITLAEMLEKQIKMDEKTPSPDYSI